MILNNFFSTKKVAEETKFVKIYPSEKVKETLKVMKPQKKMEGRPWGQRYNPS
jgi:hypothetical protein